MVAVLRQNQQARINICTARQNQIPVSNPGLQEAYDAHCLNGACSVPKRQAAVGKEACLFRSEMIQGSLNTTLKAYAVLSGIHTSLLWIPVYE